MNTAGLLGAGGRGFRLAAVMAGVLAVAAIALLGWSNGASAAPGDADLSLTKSDSPDPVSPQGTLTYTIVVTNPDANEATNVVVTDTLDEGVSFISATPGTCDRQGKTVTCNLGTLAANSTATVTIVVKAPKKAGTITNTATVTSPEDDTPLNNTDTETTTVSSAGPSCGGRAATIVGTLGDDTITGTDQRDVIVTFAGNDLVFALGGNDFVCTKKGDDTARGGSGGDTLIGGGGADKLAGKSGNDTLKGKKGRDRLRGRGGSDVLNGGGGIDSCKGGGGRDFEKRCP